jgi:hypothetical protein
MKRDEIELGSGAARYLGIAKHQVLMRNTVKSLTPDFVAMR